MMLHKISKLLLLDPCPTSHCCYEFDPEVNGRKAKEATFSVRNGMKKDAVVLMEAWEVSGNPIPKMAEITFRWFLDL